MHKLGNFGPTVQEIWLFKVTSSKNFDVRTYFWPRAFLETKFFVPISGMAPPIDAFPNPSDIWSLILLKGAQKIPKILKKGSKKIQDFWFFHFQAQFRPKYTRNHLQNGHGYSSTQHLLAHQHLQPPLHANRNSRVWKNGQNFEKILCLSKNWVKLSLKRLKTSLMQAIQVRELFLCNTEIGPHQFFFKKCPKMPYFGKILKKILITA